MTPEQKQFCEEFITQRGVASRAYAIIYSRDPLTCGGDASTLLKNPEVLSYIMELMNSNGFTEQAIDLELHGLIQQNDDRKLKLDAIKEFNKLKQRIVDKLEVIGSISVDELNNKLAKVTGESK